MAEQTPFERFVNKNRARDEGTPKGNETLSDTVFNAGKKIGKGLMNEGGGLLKDLIANKLGLGKNAPQGMSLPESSPYDEVIQAGRGRVRAKLQANRDRIARKKANQ